MDKFKEDLIEFIKNYDTKEKKLIEVKGHPFGERIESKWLAVDIVRKESHRGQPQIYYRLPGNGDRKIHIYYYDLEKFELDNGFMWGLKIDHLYLIENVRYQHPGNTKSKWVWEKAWCLPVEEFSEFCPPIRADKPAKLIETLEEFFNETN